MANKNKKKSTKMVARPQPKKSNRKKAGSSALSKCSKAGLAYIKCNTCPFDFVSTDFMGIPDEYAGKTIAKKHQHVGPTPAMVTGNDYYFLTLPIPGVAYAFGARATGTTGAMTLTCLSYPEAGTLFPLNSETTNVIGARHASNVFELINTTNDMVWGGSIQVSKGFIRESISGDGTTSSPYMSIDGTTSLVSNVRPQVILPSKEGVFVTASPITPDNEFMPIRSKTTFASVSTNTISGSGFENITIAGPAGLNYTCLSQFESILVKITNPPTGSTFIVRTEACVEYQVNQSSILYEYSHFSPGYDPTALALLAAFRKSHPAAVPFKDNARFWDEVLKWARSITAALKVLPGPAGLVSSGVNTILEAF